MQGMTTGYVRAVLRIEGLAELVLALTLYSKYGMGWKVFLIFFLAPDLAFVGYLAGARAGSIAYNLTHSFTGAVTCLLIAIITASPIIATAGMIWFAHIGFDRALGYGLKYSRGFGFTHLGLVGRARDPQQAMQT